MSEEPNEKMHSFLKINLILFLFYAIIGSLLAGTIEIIAAFLPIHFIILIITGFFAFVLNKDAGQVLGYVILFLLLFAIVGFSICVGSINIH
jgi:hypothetical protein